MRLRVIRFSLPPQVLGRRLCSRKEAPSWPLAGRVMAGPSPAYHFPATQALVQRTPCGCPHLARRRHDIGSFLALLFGLQREKAPTMARVTLLAVWLTLALAVPGVGLADPWKD